MQEPHAWYNAKKEKGMEDMSLDPALIEDLIDQRNNARKNRDFARSDEIRDLLQSKHIILEDGPDGTSWRLE